MSQSASFLIEYFFASVVLYAGYLILRRWVSPGIRRYFLLAALLLPFFLPFIHLSGYAWTQQESPLPAGFATTTSLLKDHEIMGAEDLPVVAKHISSEVVAEKDAIGFDWMTPQVILTSLYLLVCSVLFLRMLITLIAIFKMLHSSTKMTIDSIEVNLIESAEFAGANFFRWILLNSAYTSTRQVNTILAHENVHRKQGHSIDALLYECNLIIAWINPISWFLAKESRLNNELIADEVVGGEIGSEAYLTSLVDISLNYPQSLLQLFSALSIKQRINQLRTRKPTDWTRTIPVAISFFLLALLPVACTDPIDQHEVELADKSLTHIKKITSTYISHQEDTQEKDDQIVSIAYFNEDQSLQKLDNYTSYPYTSVEPKTREFMRDPSPNGLFTVMDGLTLEHSERNFLFGHDWPRLMARQVQSGILPETRGIGETSYEIVYEKDDLPREIFTHWKAFGNTEVTLCKGFTYEGDRISSLRINRRMPLGGQSSDRNKSSTGTFKDDVEYIYNGDQLERMNWGKKSWTFRYEGGLLIETIFYINDRRFNQRKYFYNNQGLKIRTEIFNTYEEPEYTILYDYEYYPSTSS